ncbi:MAG: DUF2336 domain-containing protein [Caulobacteraceae bacterium]|nr:DUF2336 domain-containing protein [Caulobacteraceae bacterium]
MSTTRTALTDEDIRALIKSANVDERAMIAHKLCRTIDREKLSDEDREKAHEILRVMAADAAELVRRALAVTLRSSPLVPRDVALKLARDVESIALPVLNFSPAFNDEDLVEIVRLADPVRQVAVAQRPQLSEKVTGAIVEYGAEAAVETACANDNARFAERSLQGVIARFERSERVLAAVAYRQVLPMSVTERLIDMVGDELRDHLLNHQAVSPELALQIALGAKERATIDLVDQAGRASDIRAFVSHLNRAGRLSPSLLLRAAAHGHFTFLDWGVAELAGVPHHRTWLMIHDAGPLGLRAIYERAGLPARLFAAFRAAVDTFHALEGEAVDASPERFQQLMLQRYMTQGQLPGREDVDYLLDKMDRVSRGQPKRLAKVG